MVRRDLRKSLGTRPTPVQARIYVDPVGLAPVKLTHELAALNALQNPRQELPEITADNFGHLYTTWAGFSWQNEQIAAGCDDVIKLGKRAGVHKRVSAHWQAGRHIMAPIPIKRVVSVSSEVRTVHLSMLSG